MNARQKTRRTVLGLAFAALVGLATIFDGGGASAQNNGGLDDWGSKAAFQEWCDLIGGGWVDSPGDNMTICVYPDGSREVCDQNGGNCTIYSRPAPSGGKRAEFASGVSAGATLTVETVTPIPPRFTVAAVDASISFDLFDDEEQP